MARFLQYFEEELELARAFQEAGMRQRLDPDELGEDLCQSLVIEISASLWEMQEGAFLDLPHIGALIRQKESFSFNPSLELCEDISQCRYRLDDFLRENTGMMRLRKKDIPLWKQAIEKLPNYYSELNDSELNVCDDIMLQFFASWLLDSIMHKDKLLKRVSLEKFQEAVFLFLHDLIVCGYSVELSTVGTFGPLGFDLDDNLLHLCQTLKALDKNQQTPCPVEFITLRDGSPLTEKKE